MILVDPCIVMQNNTDASNVIVTNYVKNNFVSTSIWNRVVNTIKNSNIDMEKVIKDSIEYGLDVGLFQQDKGGKVVPMEIINDISSTNNDLIKTPAKENTKKQIRNSSFKMRSLPKSNSGSLTCSSNSVSFSIQTRRSMNNADHKNTIKHSSDVRGAKRPKSESVSSLYKDSKLFTHSTDRQCKIPRINLEMARAVPICAYCLGDELINNRTKVQEDMIVCWDCGTCAHPSCLRWPKSLLEKVRTIRWQCLQCKCCSYCGNISKKDDDMILCDVCDLGFHMYCFSPPIKTLPKGQWVCRLCKPGTNHNDTNTFFSKYDFNFTTNCQIVTSENVQALCRSRKKVPDPRVRKKTKVAKFIFKPELKVSKQQLKLSLLQRKRKKLIEKAVKRQNSALFDGLSSFFTPGNKRQSRVSKKTLTGNNHDDLTIHKPAEPGFLRPRGLRIPTKSPNFFENDRIRKQKDELLKYCKAEMTTNMKASNSESQAFNSDSVCIKSQAFMSKSKEATSLDYCQHTIKPLRKSKKRVTVELKTNSVPEPSTRESSNATTAKNDNSSDNSTMFSDNTETDPYPISDMDRQWYSEIQNKVAELLPPPMDAPPHLKSLNKATRLRTEHSEPPELLMEGHIIKDNNLECFNPSGDNVCNPNQRFPPRIQIGKYVIDTWYSSPYPSEYARLNVLYICEYCLKHMKSYDVYVMHTEKCMQNFPPGNEIYRNGDLSIFEVDGYVSKLYCQQLCLLAKLFLDHKTLYYDVEPFLFYVAVVSRNQSCHIVGYFSKEKRSTHKYNLSCIMVLPPYQKFNYGRFLIDFSYLLSRNEGENGSPEKPLSTLGRLSYESYWKSKVIPYLLNRDNVTGEFYRHVRFSKPPKGLSITIDKISIDTGINPHDVASTIQMLSKTVDLDESDRITIQLDWNKIKLESEKYAKKYHDWIPLKAEYLRWVPLTLFNDKVQQNIVEQATLLPEVNQSINSTVETKPHKNIKASKTYKTSYRKTTTGNSYQKSKKNSNRNMSYKDSRNKDRKIRYKSHKRDNTKTNTPKRQKTMPLSLKLRSLPRYKLECTEKRILTRNRYDRPHCTDEFQIVTRNRSLQSTVSKHTNKLEPIKVDLTSSDNSDNQDNDDCIFISSETSMQNSDWKNSRPVLEIFKESLISMTDYDTSKSKSSPTVNTNEPSPESLTQHTITCSNLISPEIDLEDETETDLILSGSRQPLIILEKCDTASKMLTDNDDVVDLSDDLITDSTEDSIKPEITADLNSKTDSTELVSIDESQQSDTVPTEFFTPTGIKEPNNLEDIAPILSRFSSENSNSGHQEESSHSLQLPSDISLNEEFKRFYNDGNIFNTITTSHTDSSDKDADESLLSVSNSDLEINGAYSCDSSICCNHKATSIVNKSGEEPFEDHVRSSPCQSDLMQSQVSSTTPFITPSIVWNASTKNIDHTKNLENTKQQYHNSKSSDGISVSGIGYEEVFGKEEDLSVGDSVDKDIVSSSLGNAEDSCVQDELVVSSMATPQLSPKLPKG